MGYKVKEGVPKHFAEFLTASYELFHLAEAHNRFLANKHKSETFQDSETVFMRAGITLLCSAWEAYVEDLTRNAIAFLIENCKSPDDIPLEVRKNIAKEIKDDKQELSPWKLAGDNWRKELQLRFETTVAKKANTLNTPKSSQIRAVYSEMLGIEDITLCWKWEFFEPATVCGLVDHLVAMRGSIAHGRPTPFPAESIRLIYLQRVVAQCACLMNNFIREKLIVITGKDPWALVRSQTDWKHFGTELDEDSTGQ